MAVERIYVATLRDVPPGHMYYVDVDGLPVALANVGGTIYAFSDSCRHEGGPLSSGILRDRNVTCPWHGWTYDIETGVSIVPPLGLRIATYPVIIQNEHIYLDIEW